MTRSARLVTALAVAAALLSTTGCNKLLARDKLNKGVQAYKAAKYEKSIEYFKDAVRLDSDLKVAKLYLATAYMQQYVPGVDTPDNNANAQQAVEQYSEVLKNDPKNITALKGIASLYMNMKRFNDSADYYKRAIDADPNDPEAYYSVGVIDWTAVYKDTADRKNKAGLAGVEAPMKTKQDLKLCEQIKADNEPKVDEGLKMLDTAIQKRQDYDDAMTYMNLLYLRKADMACDDSQAAAKYRQLSEKFTNEAMAARKKKFDEAAKKTNGGIVLDQKK
ncbi:MAG TPA: tetratricopeptide repeat protein [Candidatus Angelobacter sp.]|nr:tetratricopeptide repeat protein [Candidatus Angelobacter sp.]